MAKKNGGFFAKVKNTDHKDLTEEELEKQEHLNDKWFELLKPKHTDWNHLRYSDSTGPRPTANLVDLMQWAKSIFSSDLKDVKTPELNCYIHNKIVIDGSFLSFCETDGVKVECLYRDSVASWKSDSDYEHFMCQGVFLITKGDLQFLHCALFHKGNQNEDEVSFFVVVEDKHFREYVSLRNKFDKWLIDRDREHLQIHVVGGEGYSYSRDLSWEDLFLPDALKQDIRQSVEGFLAAKSIYEKAKVPWKRGILLYGEPGNGKTTAIRTIISQYNFKPVTIQSGSQTNDDVITEAFAYAQDQEPGLLYIEDLDTLLSQYISLSHFLQMMDGVSSKNGIMVIATANDIGKLKESVTDRPSRFDRKWEIPLPDAKMSRIYLQRWFGDTLSGAEYNKIVKSSVDNNFSYAYLKELYLTSVFNALARGKEVPELVDIKAATSQLLSDKEAVRENFELTTTRQQMGIM